MTRQMILAHPLVGTEGDHYGDLLSPALNSGVRSPHQQRQRAGPGTIRHHQADTLVIKISASERLRYEGGDLIAGELLVHAAYDVCPRWVARIRTVVRRCFYRCRGRHACILDLSAGHTSTVHPPHRQDKIASSRRRVIRTVDPVAAQQHGSAVLRSP
jgi:hypothetical protein